MKSGSPMKTGRIAAGRGAIVAVAGAALLLSLLPAAAAPPRDSDRGVVRHRRAPSRITVSPRYPYSTVSTPYPKPYRYEYPGPGAVRQCVAQLVPENRPSGPVIYPRMECYWEQPRR